MLTVMDDSYYNVIGFEITGQMTLDDIEIMADQLESIMDCFGKVRLLVHLRDFAGFQHGVIWEDVKFSRQHRDAIARLAVVAPTRWQRLVASMLSPLVNAQTKIVDEEHAQEAWEWVQQCSAAPAATTRAV